MADSTDPTPEETILVRAHKLYEGGYGPHEAATILDTSPEIVAAAVIDANRLLTLFGLRQQQMVLPYLGYVQHVRNRRLSETPRANPPHLYQRRSRLITPESEIFHRTFEELAREQAGTLSR